MVEQLARFLGVSCDKAQLEALSEHCHQLVDQCCNAEALPVGRGTHAAPPPCPPRQHPLPWATFLQSPLLREGQKAIESRLLCGWSPAGPSAGICLVAVRVAF